jgi:hypothetical protein
MSDLNNIPRKEHYSVDSDYLRSDRIHSYAHQIKTVIEQRPANIIEIGKGPGMVAAALKSAGISVTTLDPQIELEPDLVGSVVSIPAADKLFDVGLCCQVLEHLPFRSFEVALVELRRVTKFSLVLSLPDVSPAYFIRCKLPFGANVAREFSRPKFQLPEIPESRYEEMGHFWEIGYRGTSLPEVMNGIQNSGWKIEHTWRVPEKTWHRFFLLKN